MQNTSTIIFSHKTECNSLQTQFEHSRYQSYMVTTRLSLTETSVQNPLTARAKSLLHTSSSMQYKVEVARCYCYNEWHELNTVQKIQKDKICNENLILHCKIVNYSDKPKKWPTFSKIAKCVLSWPAQLKNGQLFRNGQSGDSVFNHRG